MDLQGDVYDFLYRWILLFDCRDRKTTDDLLAAIPGGYA
jgi:hypothetical protein